MPPCSAGKLLFSDSDWLQLVARVASPTMPLITEDKAAPVAGLPGQHPRQLATAGSSQYLPWPEGESCLHGGMPKPAHIYNFLRVIYQVSHFLVFGLVGRSAAAAAGMLDMLHFMLVRDARMRPTLADVQAR